jgi:hypothetical protein
MDGTLLAVGVAVGGGLPLLVMGVLAAAGRSVRRRRDRLWSHVGDAFGLSYAEGKLTGRVGEAAVVVEVLAGLEGQATTVEVRHRGAASVSATRREPFDVAVPGLETKIGDPESDVTLRLLGDRAQLLAVLDRDLRGVLRDDAGIRIDLGVVRWTWPGVELNAERLALRVRRCLQIGAALGVPLGDGLAARVADASETEALRAHALEDLVREAPDALPDVVAGLRDADGVPDALAAAAAQLGSA